MSYRTNRRTKNRFVVHSRKGRGAWSSVAKEYVDDKTNYLIEEEGKSPSQAYAIAISIARKEGYKIPKRRVVNPKKKRGSYVPFASVAESISERAG